MVRTICCEKTGLKKGAWTPEEDKKLVAYVTRHGLWNWREIPKYAGCMNLDLAINEEKPEDLIDESTSDQRDYYAKWQRNNNMSLRLIKANMSRTIRRSILDKPTTREYIDAIKEQYVSTDSSTVSTLIAKLGAIKYSESKDMNSIGLIITILHLLHHGPYHSPHCSPHHSPQPILQSISQPTSLPISSHDSSTDCTPGPNDLSEPISIAHQTIPMSGLRRWAAIAAKLPGRADNEIKNHWHTNLKKRLKQESKPAHTSKGGSDSSECKDNNKQESEPSTLLPNAPSLQTSENSPLSPVPSLSDFSSSSSDFMVEISTNWMADEYAVSSDKFAEVLSGDFWTEPYVAGNSYIQENFPETLAYPEILFPLSPISLEESLFTGSELEASKPSANEDIVSQLADMGFNNFHCQKAAINTSNAGVEEAMNWLLSHMNDPDIDDPVSQEATAEEEIAQKALKASGGDIEKATDWIFNHPQVSASPDMDATSSSVQSATDEGLPDGGGRYKLIGLVSHIGTSTQCGHYVAHVYKDRRWVIFNDNKAEASVNPPKDMGYLYFFERLNG
ncbi:hypothetical protein NE237_031283 [Protea cynaroides]|uniref:ubiquitinyl hydrolase 1 n=1 Tax=Protea cynaroides TaxID=273540 RepID=A0A9Q0L1T5_9MAGN|nr:hypothetical protein NE237_031283 [Protea cynaroides]